jgi:riboflavin kinase/FMN adenylyltransferase
MALAKTYLGEPFELHGKVIQGNAMGRSIGFPTANLDIESDTKLIPKLGVYAVNVVLGDGTVKEGMMNIGLRPTIANHDNLSLEVNLFDFEGNLYDQYITVQLLSRFRDEKKFDSIPDLREQLTHDKETIRAYFNSLV